MSKEYTLRKDYYKTYYKGRRENKEWVEEQKIKMKQYKTKKKEILKTKTKAYRSTYLGMRSHKISEWRRKLGVKETNERFDMIFDNIIIQHIVNYVMLNLLKQN